MSTALAKVEDKQIEALRQIMTQRTPEKEIRTRPGRGGKPLKYTDGAYVIRTLNEGFGWDWDFVADNEQLIEFNGQPFEVKVRGTLTVRYKGLSVTKTQFGCQPIEMLSNGTKPVSIGDAYKGAATDAMKKCASLLGIALDLYDSDYKAEKYETEPEPVRNVKLEGAQPQPTKPADILLDLNRTLGYTEAQLLKWLIGKFTLDGAQSLSLALNALTFDEISQAIDIFRQKVERA
jgi:hypothetical protein